MDEKCREINTKQYSLKLNPAIAESLACFSKQMSEVTKNMGLAFQSIEETYTNFIESISPIINKFALQYQKQLNRQNIFSPFIECGLWLAPSMTPGIVMVVMGKYEQGKNRAIPAIVEGFYRRNNYAVLRHTIANWNSLELFFPRMHIFMDALDAHIAGKWTLSIPALLPHIEGIAGEILRANHLPIKNSVTIVKNGGKNLPSSVFGSYHPTPESSISYTLTASFLDYLERTLYSYESFENPKVRTLSKLNRHAILHGYNIAYANRLNSLRCFLALDSLSIFKEKL